MIIKYYKTENNIPFYKYSLEPIPVNKKKWIESEVVLTSSNPEFENENEKYEEITEVEYNELINKLIQGYVV